MNRYVYRIFFSLLLLGLVLQVISAQDSAGSKTTDVAYLQKVFPGTEAEFSFLMHNTSSRSEGFTLRLHDEENQFSGVFLVQGKSTGTFDIASDSSIPVDLKLRIPETTVPGTYQVAVEYTGTNGTGGIVPFAVRVNPAFSLAVTSSTDPVSVVNGGDLTFPVTIRNTGRSTQTDTSLNLKLPSGWSYTLEPNKAVSLQQGAAQTFTVHVTVPAHQSSGTRQIVFRGVSGSSKSPESSVTVKVVQNPHFLLGLLGVLLVAVGVLLFINFKRGRR